MIAYCSIIMKFGSSLGGPEHRIENSSLLLDSNLLLDQNSLQLCFCHKASSNHCALNVLVSIPHYFSMDYHFPVER